MQYMLLIYHDEVRWEEDSEAERAAIYLEYRKLIEELTAKGSYRAGSQLKPTALATTVRVRDGKRLLTDGPFAETKEQLGGFMLVDVPDLAEAVAIAARIPAATGGSIEVRPLVVRGESMRA